LFVPLPNRLTRKVNVRLDVLHLFHKNKRGTKFFWSGDSPDRADRAGRCDSAVDMTVTGHHDVSSRRWDDGEL
jgi:hypothetical protein